MSENHTGNLPDVTGQQCPLDQIITDNAVGDEVQVAFSIQVQNNNNPQDAESGGVNQASEKGPENTETTPVLLTAAAPDVNIEVGPHMPEQRELLVPRNFQEPRVPLEYQKGFPVVRFSRKYRRQEVQGLCSVCVEIMCLASIACLSLNALGYMDLQDTHGHVPATFSWQTLREFFSYQDYIDKDCLFYSRGSRVPKKYAKSGSAEILLDLDYPMFDPVDAKKEKNIVFANKVECDFRRSRRSNEWLVKLLSANFMPLLNVATSTVFLVSMSARRRKGLQVLLLLPSFLCFFLSVFQLIPLMFHHSYVGVIIRDNMRLSIEESNPPIYINPMIAETQIAMKCCGIEDPTTWQSRTGYDLVPASCCNTTAFDCPNKTNIPIEKSWVDGCSDMQFERVHSYEKWGLLLFVVKVMAEVIIFITLSDLTRYDYPPPEATENSRCEYTDYVFKCRGVLQIRGLTKDGWIVVETNYLLPWRLIPSRIDLVHGLSLQVKTDLNQVKGTVEIIKRRNLDTFLNEDIQMDVSRKGRGIYAFHVV